MSGKKSVSILDNISPNQGLTYDDVLLRPGYSDVFPSEVNVQSRFSENISLNVPIVSSAMDTVTESQTAIGMAREGGIGVIHKNLPPELQAREVEKVKKYESGMILEPFTIHPEATLSEVKALTEKYKVTGMPVVDKNGVVVGILTNRDMSFEENPRLKVKDMMTSRENLITAMEGVSMNEAKKLLHKHRIEKLPVIDKKGKLKGLITIRDIKKSITYPHSNKDKFGRLRVAAAIGVGEKEIDRAALLVAAGIDALVVDTAHGHSRGVIEMVKKLKKLFPCDVIAGNVATAKACQDLIRAGANGIKVGIGPGSICTTRVVAGIGVPQFSAIVECSEECHKAGIPVIADGGVKYSGDVVKALAGGASSVMIGSLFAGTDESPGEMILYQGRAYKIYRGMGSLGAMGLGSKDRYAQGHVEELNKLVPEGIEGQVPYRGALANSLYQLVGGLRSGMGYVGAKNLHELRLNAEFIKISAAALKESHPHDIIITKEAPNYQVS